MNLTPTERLAILADTAETLRGLAIAHESATLDKAAAQVRDALQAARELVTEDETATEG